MNCLGGVINIIERSGGCWKKREEEEEQVTDGICNNCF